VLELYLASQIWQFCPAGQQKLVMGLLQLGKKGEHRQKESVVEELQCAL
jgi:hypothetical protein